MPTVTLSQLQSRIYSRLDGNSSLYTSNELTSAINENIRYVNLLTGYIQSSQTITTTSNTVWYTTPTGIIVPTSLTFNSVYLNRFSLNGLGQAFPYFLSDTTANTGIAVSNWALAGVAMFAIHPADSIGGNTLSVTGIQEPTLLVNSTDTIQIPDEFSEIVEDLSVVYLTFKESGAIFQQSLTLYQKAMEKLRVFRRWVHRDRQSALERQLAEQR